MQKFSTIICMSEQWQILSICYTNPIEEKDHSIIELSDSFGGILIG